MARPKGNVLGGIDANAVASVAPAAATPIAQPAAPEKVVVAPILPPATEKVEKIEPIAIVKNVQSIPDTILALRPAHVEYLKQHYDDGTFLVSGPQVPRAGGLILARAASRSS